MDEREEKIKRIADSLVKSGLAVNETEAFRKAEEIIATEEKIEPKIDVKVEKQITDNLDITKEDKTINELMQEAGVDVDKIKEVEGKQKIKLSKDEKGLEKSKTFQKDFPTSESKDSEETGREEVSKENIAEKKVEKGKTGAEENKEEPKENTTEKKVEKEQKKQKTNEYEEEEKVDISKVFNYGKKS